MIITLQLAMMFMERNSCGVMFIRYIYLNIYLRIIRGLVLNFKKQSSVNFNYESLYHSSESFHFSPSIQYETDSHLKVAYQVIYLYIYIFLFKFAEYSNSFF